MLKSGEIAKALNVSAESVRQYADAGRIPFVETPGGHRRYVLEDVKHALRMEKVQKFVSLEDGDAVVLSSAPEHAEPLKRTRGWRAAPVAAMIADAHEPTGDDKTIRIPFIGVPGSSRFVAGQGVRT